MSYDLAIDRNNDLVFAASRDLLAVDGTALQEQRIRVRLKIRRGSWALDDSKTLGSRLDTVLSRTAAQSMPRISALVQEALSGAEDIEVTSVEVAESSNTMLTVIVGYVPLATEIQSEVVPADEQQLQEATIEFQL